MPKLKTLSGGDLVKIFSLFGFEVEAQRGSHAKLRRLLPGGTRQTLTIPLHDEMDKGTLKAIYRQALRYLTEDQLRSYFYGDWRQHIFRPIQRLIPDPLAMKLVDGEIAPGEALTVDGDTKKGTVTFEPAAAKAAWE